MPISGLGVGILTVGGFFVYTGIENVTVLDGLRQILRGQPITKGAQTSTNLSPTDIASAANSATAIGNASNAPPPVGPIQNYAKAGLAAYGWSNQWAAFNSLVMSESGWNPYATNPTSGAYGIPQALPASKLPGGTNSTYQQQIDWMLAYIKSRYGSPSAAWAFHLKNNWY